MAVGVLMGPQKKDSLDRVAQVASILGSGIGAVGGLYDIARKSKENDALGLELKKKEDEQKQLTGLVPDSEAQLFQSQTGFELPKGSTYKQRNDLLANLKAFSETGKSAAEAKGAQLGNTIKQNEETRKTESHPLEIQGKKLGNQKTAAEINDLAGGRGKTADLRKEYTGLPITKATQEMAVSYNKMLKAAQNPDGPNDMSIIYGIMKMNDPGSTVREGEYATAENTGPAAQKFTQLYNKVLAGDKLTPEQRAQFVGAAQNLYASQIEQQKRVDSQYSSIAQKFGMDPKYVLQPFEIDEKQASESVAKIQGMVPKKEEAVGFWSSVGNMLSGSGPAKAQASPPAPEQDMATKILRERQQQRIQSQGINGAIPKGR